MMYIIMNTFSSWHRNDTRWRPVLSDYENKSSHHFITTGCDWTLVWDSNRQTTHGFWVTSIIVLCKRLIIGRWQMNDFEQCGRPFYCLTWRKPPASAQLRVFGLTNSPLNTAKVLNDNVGHSCSESMQCGGSLLQTFTDEFIISPTVTLHQD